MSLRKCLLIALPFLASTGMIMADNWPTWRGPTGNSLCKEKNIPVKWKGGDETWRTEIPGWGSSTPVIWNDRMFLTTAVGRDLLALCYDTSGKLVWKKSMGSGSKVVRGGEGNSACISAVTDGRHVWFKTSTGAFACFDFNGKEIWRVNLQKMFGTYRLGFIVTDTPVLYKGRLYIHLMHDGESYVAALDAKTGRKVWYTVRETGARDECKHAYTSPILYDDGKERFLVSHGSDYTIAYDLDSGRELWRCGGFHPKRYHRTLRFVATPTMVPGLIVSPSAKNESWLAIRPTGARGKITGNRKHVIWTQPSDTPDVSAPLIADGKVYISREKGGITLCLDARTGKVHYKNRIHEGLYRASPMYADGHVYHTCRDGTITVVKAGPSFKVVSTNKLRGEPMTASPAVSNGILYLRTHKALYALKK